MRDMFKDRGGALADAPLAEQIAALELAVQRNPVAADILDRAQELNLLNRVPPGLSRP